MPRRTIKRGGGPNNSGAVSSRIAFTAHPQDGNKWGPDRDRIEAKRRRERRAKNKRARKARRRSR